MAAYYYLMAQLPGIVSGAPVPITYEAFKETAKAFLTRRDRETLDKLVITSYSIHYTKLYDRQ